MIWLALLLIFPSAPAYALQQPIEERVVVTANAYPVPFENLSRAVTVLTREDLDRLPSKSIADILANTTSIDIRSRAPFGIQNDISVRGSAFSQVLVLVDGMRMNNSQTGHHNADFPVPLQDVDRIEVLLGSGSSLYGADAFGGIVNIITRRRSERASASISGGQHGYLNGSFSMGWRRGRLDQSISASASRSSGFQYDRDFRNISIGGRTGIGDHTTFYVSHVNKEFGANGFYGPSPSREWTNQTFVAFENTRSGRSGNKAIFQVYYRTHGDRFLYDIRSPGLFENNHRTHAIGASAKLQFKTTDAGLLTLGGEMGEDWISSGNLGDHAFARSSLFGELQWLLGRSAAIYPGFRLDYYSNFGISANPSLSGSWWVLPRIRLRSSVGRAFRIPSFTELYYRDPNNEADPSLKPESSWSTEAGIDFIPAKQWLGTLTLFSRSERNVIDWIRTSAAEKWRTANIRKLRATGAEIGIERSLGPRSQLGVRYSRISLNPGRMDYSSKYVLDYARDSWTAAASFSMPFALEYKQTFSYKRRADGRDYWLLDGCLERNFRHFAAGVDFSNLLNSRYQEVMGVDMPGRWFAVCLRTR
ncbi:MAG: TonB-dependent receptor [Acidobacteria bacterium]|nr:TonB-dependent receptor [Acidobacteriota bacterium]